MIVCGIVLVRRYLSGYALRAASSGDALLRAGDVSPENWLMSELERLDEVPGLLDDRDVAACPWPSSLG
jgi:hypothetical protein